ncbi:37S RIBOSOMAL PROTEIN S22 [Salix viminalis]|uniref:37S RIBOSOMAL PROTEIN S22 n=1 Tax=Salix viminalis TaxID=40686 RepID=A0A9Q0TMA3_SALVM|nr:37S RIBOSOMAL PROTEIN S22 [Salix viminalis]
MASLIPETTKKLFTAENLRSASKQSDRCLIVPVRLRRAIKKYLREQEEPHMKKKVLRLSESFRDIKDKNLMLTINTSKELVEDPFKSMDRSKRWKIKKSSAKLGEGYRVFPRLKFWILELGTGSAFWAIREVWPKSLQKVNLVEPSQSMQRAGRSLIQDLKDLPLIHSYNSLQDLSKSTHKSERKHDLVFASYVLGEIPSLKDRITIVRQLWELTGDVLVLIEPGTPHGFGIISQMRSHILWMEKRKFHKAEGKINETCKDLMPYKGGAFVIAPCSHDGSCPLVKSGKYCHFVQRLQRTTSQRVYKRSKGETLRGFEDEKFSFVAFRRGQRPRKPWPLDGMKFETLKEQHAKRNPEDLEIDYEDLIDQNQPEEVPYEEVGPICYDSDAIETDTNDDHDEEEQEQEAHADLGGGWGRIVFSPFKRGRQVTMDVCRSNNRDNSEGCFERIVVTQSKSPALHNQARRAHWGDLWPF